jgi:hypothetical protein
MKILTVILLSILLIGCKSSKHAGCDAYGKVEPVKKESNERAR